MPPKLKPTCFSIVKCPLKNIVIDKKMLKEVENAITRVNQIVSLTYQFLNSYLVHCYKNKIEFPKLDETLIRFIIHSLTYKDNELGPKPDCNPERDSVHNYLWEHFINNIYHESDIECRSHLIQCLLFEETGIMTNIENNVREHFVDYVNKLVNAYFDVKGQINVINKSRISKEIKKERRDKVYKEAWIVKNDIKSIDEDFISDEVHHRWIKKIRKNIIPEHRYPFEDHVKNVTYDVKIDPIAYLPSLYYIVEQLQKINNERREENRINGKDNNNEIKLFQVIPQRTDNVLKHINIDTSVLLELAKGREEYRRWSGTPLRDYDKCRIWENFINLHDKIFKRKLKKYLFNYSIKTDGISVCISFVKKDKDDPDKPQTTKNEKAEIHYIEDSIISDKMKNKTVVAIDPGTSDLIHCATLKNNECSKYRYTYAQRQTETRHYKYEEIRRNLREQPYNGTPVKEIEKPLTNFNSKSLDGFDAYCKKKNEISFQLREFNQMKIHRKLNLNAYINRQKSESSMLRNFSAKFGPAENCLILFGDWDCSTYKWKGRAKAISSNLKYVFKKNGYQIRMINEYNTSKICNACGKKCVKHIRDDGTEVWGLLRCTNTDNCQKYHNYHNRDTNACRNMLKIFDALEKGEGRPKIYTKPPQRN